MDRLEHSPLGEIKKATRSLKKCQISIYIEGYKDEIFYRSICESVLEKLGISYRIVDCRGKKPLLKLHSTAKSDNKLLSDFDDVRKALFFFLDKDVDDLLDKMIDSDHVVYTEYYEVENYYFLYGNLANTVSSCIHLHVKNIEGDSLKNSVSWTQAAAENWKDWVVFCLTAALNSGKCENYGSERSGIHESAYGLLNEDREAELEDRLRQKLNTSKDEFRRMKENAYERVERIYKAGQYDKIFKGRWYCNFLCEDIERLAKIHKVYNRHLRKGLCKHILTHLVRDLTDDLSRNNEWVKHFVTPLEQIAEKIVDTS